MKYSFNDLLKDEVYENGLAIIIAGQYSIFNNMVSDRFKDKAVNKDNIEIDMELMAEFGVEGSGDMQISTAVDLETFRDVIGSANINGKWYCKVYWRDLSKKNMEYVQNYIKYPNDNGIMVIIMEQFKDYKFFLRNRILQNSKSSHLIQLSFPNRKMLVPIVIQLFRSGGSQITEEAAELFVMRMSANYDEYSSIANRVLESFPGMDIDKARMEKGLKGVDNYIIDDFIEQLLKPLSGENIQSTRKIYKMYASLLKEVGAKDFVTKIKYKVEDFIEFRRAINNGIIPIKVKFSVTEAKERLGEEHKLYKVPDFRFRRMAYIASQTSLKDWVYMGLILSNVGVQSDVEEFEKVLYTLVHRTVLNDYRINKGIGVTAWGELENQE